MGFETKRTDVLSYALWIEAVQLDILHRTGMPPQQTMYNHEVTLQGVAADILTSGGDETISFNRLELSDEQKRADNGVIRSGWMARGNPQSEDEAQLVSAWAGAQVSLAPGFIPFLQLPEGVEMNFRGNEFKGAFEINYPAARQLAADGGDTTMGGLLIANVARIVLAPNGTVEPIPQDWPRR